MQLSSVKREQRICIHDAWIILATSFVALCSAVTAVADEVAVAVEAADVVVFEGGIAAPNEKHWRMQFEPMLKVELSFVNRACKLSDDQRRNLIAKSNAWLDKFVADFVKQGGRPQPVGVWMGGGRPQGSDPRESIQAGVAKLVKAELPGELAAKYNDELRKRSEFTKNAHVENLVTRIDSELILAPQQRDNITRSLMEHWEKNWQPQLEMFVHGMDVWPAVPDQWIRPYLSPVQQIAWGRLNKRNGNTFFGGFPMDGQVIDDIDLNQRQDDQDAEAGNKRAAAALAAPARAN
jgi:hypothetical protein